MDSEKHSFLTLNSKHKTIKIYCKEIKLFYYFRYMIGGIGITGNQID